MKICETTDCDSRAQEKVIKPNSELLEHAHEKRLVTRTKSQAGGSDQDLAPLGEVNRAPKRSGKSRR